MPVLQFLEHAAENIARSSVASGADVTNAIGNAEVGTAHALGLANNVKTQTNQQQFGKTIGNYVGTNTPMHFLENVGQVGLGVATGGIGDAATGALGLSDVGGVAGGAIKGALGGASTGGAFNALAGASQGQTSGKDLIMNFLGGTVGGAVLGGGLAGAASALGSLVKLVHADFSPEDLQKMAQSEDPKQVEKILKPVTGPVIAQKAAPAIAHTSVKDPDMVSGIIDNTMREHLRPASDLQKQTEAANMGAQSYASTFGIPEEQAQQELSQPNGTDLKSTTPEKPTGLQALHESLATGENVGEAAQRYIDETGASREQTQKAIGDIMNSPDFPKGQVNSKMNPHFEEAKTLVGKATNDDDIINNTGAIHGVVFRGADKAIGEMDKLEPEDLQQVFRLTGHSLNEVLPDVQDKSQFTKVAGLLKEHNDWLQGIESGLLGGRVPYRGNYGLPLLAAPKEGEEIHGIDLSVAGKKLNPSYSLPRNVKDYQGLEEAGYSPLFQDPRDAIAFDAHRRVNNFTDLALRKGFAEAHPNVEVNNRIGAYNGQTFEQIKFHGRNTAISVPQEIAQQFNPRQELLQTSKAGAIYDNLNSRVKNFKLAGGGFHSLNVSGSYAAQQLASMLRGDVSPLRAISDLGTLVKSTFSREAFEQAKAELEAKGNNRLVDFDNSGLTTTKSETRADIQQGHLEERIPLLKQIHESIFGRQIPMMKMLIADQKFDQLGLDRHNPDDLAQMTKISKELNQNFGGINRDIQGFRPQTFKLLARGFLSTDYNEGQIRSLIDSLSKGGQEGKLAREVVFGKAFLFGALATTAGAAGGEFQGMSPKQVALDIMQKVANPEFKVGQYKVGLPTTQVAEVAKPLEQTVQGYNYNKSLTEGLQNFATNRLAALPSLGVEVGTNKNYLGQPIRGVDTHGRPISPVSTAVNLASNVLPIPAAQAGQTATGNQSIGAAIANTIGLRVTGQNQTQNLPVEQQTYISTLKQNLPNTWTDKQKSEVVDTITNFDSVIKQNAVARRKTDDQINRDIASGNISKARTDANTFNQQLYKALSKSMTPANMQYLTIPINGLKTPYQYLTGNTYGYFTNLNPSSRRKIINDNPTKYGLKIGDRI